MKRSDETKCDICGKNDSVIHIQQIMGKRTVELHLCETCAREKGIRGEDDKIEISLSGLLTGLVDTKAQLKKQEERRSCPKCGTTFGDFRKSGRLGCTECYAVFRKEITGVLEKMAASAQHRGKYPKRLLAYKTFFVDRERLKSRLAAALESEEYEKAAELRDRIRSLEETGDKS